MQKKDIKNFVIIFIVIFILELTVFNINSYRVFNSSNSKVFTSKDFTYLDDEKDITFIEINNIDNEIKTVHIELENSDTIDYEFWYTDETTQEYKCTDKKAYVDNLKNSKYITTFLSRKK